MYVCMCNAGDIFNLWAKLAGESGVARDYHMHKMKRCDKMGK